MFVKCINDKPIHRDNGAVSTNAEYPVKEGNIYETIGQAFLYSNGRDMVYQLKGVGHTKAVERFIIIENYEIY